MLEVYGGRPARGGSRLTLCARLLRSMRDSSGSADMGRADRSGILSRPARRSDLKIAAAAMAWVCIGLAAPMAGAQVQALTAQDAWIRAAPGTDMAAAYLTLRNSGAAAITVTGIESPIAGQAMIHETRVQGGKSQMRPHE